MLIKLLTQFTTHNETGTCTYLKKQGCSWINGRRKSEKTCCMILTFHFSVATGWTSTVAACMLVVTMTTVLLLLKRTERRHIVCLDPLSWWLHCCCGVCSQRHTGGIEKGIVRKCVLFSEIRRSTAHCFGFAIGLKWDTRKRVFFFF